MHFFGFCYVFFSVVVLKYIANIIRQALFVSLLTVVTLGTVLFLFRNKDNSPDTNNIRDDDFKNKIDDLNNESSSISYQGEENTVQIIISIHENYAIEGNNQASFLRKNHKETIINILIKLSEKDYSQDKEDLYFHQLDGGQYKNIKNTRTGDFYEELSKRGISPTNIGRFSAAMAMYGYVFDDDLQQDNANINLAEIIISKQGVKEHLLGDEAISAGSNQVFFTSERAQGSVSEIVSESVLGNDSGSNHVNLLPTATAYPVTQTLNDFSQVVIEVRNFSAAAKIGV